MKNNIVYALVLVVGLIIGYSLSNVSGGHGTGMMSMHLNGLTGDDFDKEFIREMIVHHEGAIDMANAALKNAKHDEIKNLANAIIVSQGKEIEDMKSWYQAWYK